MHAPAPLAERLFDERLSVHEHEVKREDAHRDLDVSQLDLGLLAAARARAERLEGHQLVARAAVHRDQLQKPERSVTFG